jgi:magnesium chelatase family protein
MAAPGHEGCRVSAVSNIMEVIEFFNGRKTLENIIARGVKFEKLFKDATNIGTIRGQSRAKEAALIAAAGGHNLLMVGPPGEGKSLLASAIPGLLPPLANEELVELTRIYSAFGALEEDGVIVNHRPMRSIHHTATKQSIIGGGSKIAKPGEITLSHLGVLFLDELGEFSAATLDSLRQPMESGIVRISRVGASVEFPSRFMLVAAMNPCPCGYFGEGNRCRCSSSEVARYQKKISGPILDRIDLQVDLKPLTADERFSDVDLELGAQYRKRVILARNRQDKRFAGTSIPFNAAIPGGSVREYCEFSPDGFDAYRKTIDESVISTRSMDRLAKVSRTIADLYNQDQVLPQHVQLGASYVLGGSLRAVFQG